MTGMTISLSIVRSLMAPIRAAAMTMARQAHSLAVRTPIGTDHLAASSWPATTRVSASSRPGVVVASRGRSAGPWPSAGIMPRA